MMFNIFNKQVEQPKDSQWLVKFYDVGMTTGITSLLFYSAIKATDCIRELHSLNRIADPITLMLKHDLYQLAFVGCALLLIAYIEKLFEYAKDWYSQRSMNHKFQWIRIPSTGS